MIVGTLLWGLLVHPEVVLAPTKSAGDEGWYEHHPVTLRALRVAVGVMLFLLGVLTGLAVGFFAVAR